MSPLTLSAEEKYRAAFERLKNGTPQAVPLGTMVTQNNVAREAGLDPSALKKSRYPTLVREIQHWIESFSTSTKPSKNKQMGKQREKNRTLRTKIQDIKLQRDNLQSLLLEADAKILELSAELNELKKLVLTDLENSLQRAE